MLNRRSGGGRVVPEIVGVGHAALTEEEVDQIGWAHPRVRVGESDDAVDESDAQHLHDGVLAQARVFTVAGPPDVGADEQRPQQPLSIRSIMNASKLNEN